MKHKPVDDPYVMRDFYRSRHETVIYHAIHTLSFESIRDAVHEFGLCGPEWTIMYGTSAISLKRRNGTMLRVDVYGTIHLDVKLKGDHRYRSTVYKNKTLDETVSTLREVLTTYLHKRITH